LKYNSNNYIKKNMKLSPKQKDELWGERGPYSQGVEKVLNHYGHIDYCEKL